MPIISILGWLAATPAAVVLLKIPRPSCMAIAAAVATVPVLTITTSSVLTQAEE